MATMDFTTKPLTLLLLYGEMSSRWASCGPRCPPLGKSRQMSHIPCSNKTLLVWPSPLLLRPKYRCQLLRTPFQSSDEIVLVPMHLYRPCHCTAPVRVHFPL